MNILIKMKNKEIKLDGIDLNTTVVELKNMVLL